jgi:uncharacterized membrane protein YdjX (TVP38/TMEM64 family)
MNYLPYVESILQWLQGNPAALFAALVILPGLGIPSSPLFLLAGAVWGADAKGCGITLAATAINLWWTHAIASIAAGYIANRPGITGRIPMPRKIRELIPKIAALGNSHPRKTTLAIRITPGIPLFIQNYSLGLMKVPTIPYLTISIPVNGIYVIGFVLTGGSILQGKTGTAVAGIAILVIATLIVSQIRKNTKPINPTTISDT